MNVVRAVGVLPIMAIDPVPAADLATQLGVPEHEVVAEPEQLTRFYWETEQGLELCRAMGGWRLVTAPDLAEALEAAVVAETRAQLSQAVLETLAVIAYLQSVARGWISGVRGVGADGIVRALLAHGLITETGEEPNGAMTFTTTSLLLQELGLDLLDELPDLAPLPPDAVALKAEPRAASGIEEQHDWAGGYPPAEGTGGGRGGAVLGQRDPDPRGTRRGQ